MAEPTAILAINLSAGECQQDLEIGLDSSARNSFESMDRPIPLSRPIEMGHQAYLIGGPYRLRRDVHPYQRARNQLADACLFAVSSAIDYR